MTEDLATYIYVSKTKVEMYFPQIPQKLLSKYSVDFNIKLPWLLEAHVERADSNTEISKLYYKLNMLIKYFKENGWVGTIDNPGPSFFEGILSMRWDVVRGECGDPTGTVYFAGHTKDTILGLGGSSKHIIGWGSDGTKEPATSYGQFFMRDILVSLTSDEKVIWDGKGLNDQDAQNAVIEYDKKWIPFESKLKFLALKISRVPLNNRENLSQKWTLLGSPLYVAAITTKGT